MKVTKQRKKPNCKNGNVACGKRCQPRHYKCPSEKSTEVSKASDKFVDNILVAETTSPTKPTTEEFYNSSLALFSKESKAERRAKIKGLSNEKELRKIQLAEENEAWVFVRLKRELDRLEKKGGEAKDAEKITELKNLLAGIMAGDGEAKAEGKERVEGKGKVSKKLSVETVAMLDAIEAEDLAGVKNKTSIAQKDTAESEAVKRLKEFGIRTFKVEEIKTYGELIANVEQRLEKVRDISSLEAPVLRMTNNIGNLLDDVIKYGDESKTKIKEAIDLLNEALEKSFDEDKSFEGILRERREILYAMKGDEVRSPAAIGDASVRDKVDIPPVPKKFASDGSSEPIDESFRNFLEEAKVLVQVSSKALIGILDSGEIKNTFASGLEDADANYSAVRRKIEEKTFGVSYDENNYRNRPIYGYVESPRHLNSAEIVQNTDGYGPIKLILRNEVKTRSTITLADSFWSEGAAPMLKPTKKLLGGFGIGSKKLVSIKHNGGGAADLRTVDDTGKEFDKARGYIEAQIFGGVSLKDIEFMSIPSYFFEEFPGIYNILVSLGISFEVVKSKIED